MLLGWTWKAHFEDLHQDIERKRWLRVADKLTTMLKHAIAEARKAEAES